LLHVWKATIIIIIIIFFACITLWNEAYVWALCMQTSYHHGLRTYYMLKFHLSVFVLCMHAT